MRKKNRKIKVAIIGAGRVGVGLAEDLISNEAVSLMYRDALLTSERKRVGREIHGIPVWTEDEATVNRLAEL